MPFTFAHPAVVLPFRRWFASSPNAVCSALVIGSVIPDFSYFFSFLPGGEISHSWFGLFMFCLPMGLLVWILWMGLIMPSLRDALPSFLVRRMRVMPLVWPESTRAWLKVLLALWLGALTHVIWDGFTHRLGFVVQMFPAMEREVFAWRGYTLTQYRLLQHASTVVGLSVVFVFCVRWWCTALPHGDYHPRDSVWLTWVFCVLILVGLGRIGWFWGTRIGEKILFLNVVWVIRWGLVSVVLYGLFWHGRRFWRGV